MHEENSGGKFCRRLHFSSPCTYQLEGVCTWISKAKGGIFKEWSITDSLIPLLIAQENCILFKFFLIFLWNSYGCRKMCGNYQSHFSVSHKQKFKKKTNSSKIYFKSKENDFPLNNRWQILNWDILVLVSISRPIYMAQAQVIRI